MVSNLEVVVGTYEQFVLGYTVDDVVNKYKMEQSFATHSHLASIRSLASNKHYLASAAADDTVCLFDMRNRMESGKLIHHSDTVNSICFTPDGSHIITASSDGTIGIVRCGSWQIEKHWQKPHKGFAVDTLAVHPTGKIALTTGHDGVLRTWNLIKGRQAYATNLVPRWKMDAKNISVLKWSPSGESYLLAANNRLDIYSVANAGIEKEIKFDSKVICVEYLYDDLIAVGLDDGKIYIYDLEKSSITVEIQAHKARVKCLAREDNLLVSASSSGEIKLWNFTKDKLTLLSEVNCSARISCMTLSKNAQLKCKKNDDEIEVAPKKLLNKLRIKQQVVIEEEIDEEKKTKRMSKKMRDKKKARKLLEETNIEENTPNTKKIKTTDSAQPSMKKQKNKEVESQLEVTNKKFSMLSKKRKDTDEIAELPMKKIKKKSNQGIKIVETENNDQNKTNKKKRKDSPVKSEKSPKKLKVTVGSEKNALSKKKKKNKNNILR